MARRVYRGQNQKNETPREKKLRQFRKTGKMRLVGPDLYSRREKYPPVY